MDKLYYINLDIRKDRLQHLSDNVLPYINISGMIIERVSAVDHTKYNHISQRGAGCSLSHIRVWKDAIDKKYNKIIVMEDDFELLYHDDTFNNTIKQLQTIDFSICNLGYNNMTSLRKTEHEGIYRCNNIQTTSCYVANVNFLKEILPTIEAATNRLMLCESYYINAIDQVWKKFQCREDWYVSKRIGKQKGSISDIERRQTNYGV